MKSSDSFSEHYIHIVHFDRTKITKQVMVQWHDVVICTVMAQSMNWTVPYSVLKSIHYLPFTIPPVISKTFYAIETKTNGLFHIEQKYWMLNTQVCYSVGQNSSYMLTKFPQKGVFTCLNGFCYANASNCKKTKHWTIQS